MKQLAYTAFVAFWSAVGTLWVVISLAGDPPVPPPDAGRGITLQELAQHNSAQSCWKAIDGVVYDFTDYLPEHPTPPHIMLRWCGKESTEAYHTKGYGSPHSAAADAMLPQYRIGVLVD
jgi:hypothetical protein